MKVGFLQAKNIIDVDWYKPLAYGYLKSYLKQYASFPVDMVFLEHLNSLDRIDILAISSTSQDISIARKLAQSAKQIKPGILTILGGHHITYLSQTLSPEFDIGVIGEGEQTFLELVNLFYNSSPRDLLNKLYTIKGIIFHDHGELRTTPRRELIDPIDQIPFPFRSTSERPYLFSSRGCPYRCAFCSSSAFWNKTRFFSAEYVVKEIELLLDDFPLISHISIWDDLFIANYPRFKKIVELIVEKKINRRTSFDLSVRANLVNDLLCHLLKQMNVKSVAFGVESGSNRILNLLNKGLTVDINQKAIDTLWRHGIMTGVSLIVGVSTETEQEVNSTFDFVIKNIEAGKIGIHHAINILMPLPGTKIWEKAVETNLIDPEQLNWDRLGVFASWRNSTIDNFERWVQHRRENKSLYLAEDTLPQEKLYKIMAEHEKRIYRLEPAPFFSRVRRDPMNFFKYFHFLIFHNLAWRKLSRALYLIFTDPKCFFQNFKSYISRHLGKNPMENGYLNSGKHEQVQSLFPFPESQLAHKYCLGKGLEIGGSTHNPFGLNTLNVDFSDSMDTPFKKEEIALCGKALPVDIVANGDDIPLPDASQDFIISSHVVEHFPNPIKALLEWDRLIKVRGIIFMIVPYKDRTFDIGRDSTPLEHLIEDYINEVSQPHEKKIPDGHDHCWVTGEFLHVINYMIGKMGVKWEIIEIQDVDDKVGNGFTIVLRKLGFRKRE